MAQESQIFAGDTSDVWEVGFVTSLPGITPAVLADLDANFSCVLSVLNSSPLINRVVTSKNVINNRFRAWLTPAETLALGRGKWIVGVELRNPAYTPPLVKEAQFVVFINSAVVPPS